MLFRVMSDLGQSTVTTLATAADNKKSIGHPSCQSMLKDIWWGQMQRDNNVFWVRSKCIYNALFPGDFL